MAKYAGHLTLKDGSHVPLTTEQAKAIWDKIELRRKERAERLPDERAALHAMCEAFDRLRELGWSDAIYCPKDGSSFDAIEAGSTGIHRCHYTGDWPDGHWWIEDAGDFWPSHPILFRLLPKEEAIP